MWSRFRGFQNNEEVLAMLTAQGRGHALGGKSWFSLGSGEYCQQWKGLPQTIWNVDNLRLKSVPLALPKKWRKISRQRLFPDRRQRRHAAEQMWVVLYSSVSQSCLSIIQVTFVRSHTERREFKSLLSKSAMQVCQQNEEEKVWKRKN